MEQETGLAWFEVVSTDKDMESGLRATNGGAFDLTAWQRTDGALLIEANDGGLSYIYAHPRTGARAVSCYGYATIRLEQDSLHSWLDFIYQGLIKNPKHFDPCGRHKAAGITCAQMFHAAQVECGNIDPDGCGACAYALN